MLRKLVLLLALLSLLPLTAVAAAATPQPSAASLLAALMNQDRAANSLPPLAPVADMTGVAGNWSATMAATGTLAHNPAFSSQICCWSRISENVGYRSVSGGDVIAAARGVHAAFMASPSHRNNILDGAANQVGIGVEEAGGRLWVTVNFRTWNGAPPPGGLANPFDDTTGFVGDPNSSRRVAAAEPVTAAARLSRARFANGAAQRVVIARDDAFPDALAGAALTGGGPLLYTATNGLNGVTRDEILRVAPRGATIYVLGGPGAISDGVLGAIAGLGYPVRRLAGRDRTATSIAIANEVRALNPAVTKAAIARAYGAPGNPTSAWADSVTGGAWAARAGVPIIVSSTDQLSPGIGEWLRANGITQTVLLGGTSALSDQVAGSVPNPRRVSGANRQGTAAQIARELWVDDGNAYVAVNLFGDSGWQYGLAAAGLAAASGAPVVGAHPAALLPETADLMSRCPGSELVAVGPPSVIPDGRIAELNAADAKNC